ncbi:MAG: hypothetical protein HOI23_15075, partial [Deltaproteobacteria bacterium]|nr:hypothetical protein [Deltaproteobacteria bacterium]
MNRNCFGTLLLPLIALGLVACKEPVSSGPDVLPEPEGYCGVGTLYDFETSLCVPNLSGDSEIDSNGQVIPAQAFEEAKIQEGKDSILASSGTTITNDICSPNLSATVEVGPGNTIESFESLHTLSINESDRHFATQMKKKVPIGASDQVATSVEEVSLNRNAASESTSWGSADGAGIHFGFEWQSDDNTTAKFRPQGIAQFSTASHDWLLVSWYSRWRNERDSNTDFGVLAAGNGPRVSLVRVTDTTDVRYRHVMLTDEYGSPCALGGDDCLESFLGEVHVGGIAYHPNNQEFHIPDSHNPVEQIDSDGVSKWYWPIHVFPLSEVYEVSDPSKYFGYGYVWRRSHKYYVPFKPSFLSWDPGRERLLGGSFFHCKNKNSLNAYYHSDADHCKNLPEMPEAPSGIAANEGGEIIRDYTDTALTWYVPPSEDDKEHFADGAKRVRDYRTCGPFFSEMQGVASNGTHLWISTSYAVTPTGSHIHYVEFNDSDYADCGE